MSGDFYQEQREQSLIKSRILSKYFLAWANVILGAQKKNPRSSKRMAYVDLFSGPGYYENQDRSTPLLVLDQILSTPALVERMVTVFNDKDPNNVENLKQSVAQLPGIDKLKYPPQFRNDEVGEPIAEMFRQMNMIPTLFFVDPWGYKGLSLNLISSIIKDWGCDCLFFFNYNRVNPGLDNESVRHHMELLFGIDKVDIIREKFEGRSSAEREKIVMEALSDGLKDSGSRYVLPFTFKNDKGTRTSHHLIFLSKSFKGYEIMKDIMYKESSSSVSGVASFEFNPRDQHFRQTTIQDILANPLVSLEEILLEEYKGCTIGFTQLYEEHSVDTPYIKKNYKDVFRKLYEEGKISAKNIRKGKPPKKGTFSDEMQIKFGG